MNIGKLPDGATLPSVIVLPEEQAWIKKITEYKNSILYLSILIPVSKKFYLKISMIFSRAFTGSCAVKRTVSVLLYICSFYITLLGYKVSEQVTGLIIMIYQYNQFVPRPLQDQYHRMNSIRTPLSRSLMAFAIILIQACSTTGKPEGVTPISDFNLDRYLGTWYEIARLDHKFERGLEQVIANYSMNADGSVKVTNKGFSTADKEWEEAVGKARFVGNSNEGHLKVSFFGPFYGSYIVFGLDEINYQYALVSGPDKSYLWILSRTPSLDMDVYNELVSTAEAAGFDTSQLIKVPQ